MISFNTLLGLRLIILRYFNVKEVRLLVGVLILTLLMLEYIHLIEYVSAILITLRIESESYVNIV